jgi:hypothetical protein
MEVKHRENAELRFSYARRDELIIDQTNISAIQEKDIRKKSD